MEALLDMDVSQSLAAVFEKYGHTAVHAYTLGLARATDQELLTLAHETGRIVVTADLDFPRLLALAAAEGPGLILFRGGNYSDAEMRELLERVLVEVSQAILLTSVCVVDRSRIRLTRLPLCR